MCRCYPTKSHRAREQHFLPAIEDILAHLPDTNVFSKLKTNSEFRQSMLYNSCSQVTTFVTLVGRCKFNRLTFGITFAPQHFQRGMSRILEGMESEVSMIDDILVFKKTSEEHERRLAEVVSRLQEGVTLKLGKYHSFTTSVKY